MRFRFSGSSACAASFGVWTTDINGELAELSTDDFTCVLQVEQPTRGLCGRARMRRRPWSRSERFSTRPHWAAVDAIRAKSCLWVPLRAYGGTACMIDTGSLAG